MAALSGALVGTPVPKTLNEVNRTALQANTQAQEWATKLMKLVFSMEGLANLLNTLEYDGFNPEAFKKMLFAHWSKIAIESGSDPTNYVADLLQKALSLVVMRGTKMKNTDKVKPVALPILRQLAENGVNLNPPFGAKIPAETITIGRIAASFPREHAMILASNPGTRLVGDAPSVAFPRVFMFSNAPSLFSLTMPTKEGECPRLWTEWRTWRNSFSKQITSNMPETVQQEALRRSVNLEQNIFRSTVLDNQARLAVAKDVLAAELRARRGTGADTTGFTALVKEMYGNDLFA